MKKYFRKSMLCLSIAGMSLTTVSCDDLGGLLNEDTISILAQLLGNIFQKGETNTYAGSATCQYLYGTYSETEGFQVSGQTDPQTLNSSVQASNTNGYVTLQFPSITVTQGEASATMNNVVISNMALDEQGKLALGTNTSVSGTIVAPDGNTYNFVNLYVGAASISSSNLSFTGSLYFGDDYSRVMNVNFSGNIVNAAQ